MERKKITVYVGETFYADTHPVESISRLSEWLDSVTKSGATHLDYGGSTEGEWSISSIDITAIYYRDETDEELNARADKENLEKLKNQKLKHEQNKREYERLKKMFEGE